MAYIKPSMEGIKKCIEDICEETTRCEAINKLCVYRESVPEMGPMIWKTYGAIPGLLNELINIHDMITDSDLSSAQSQLACAVIGLLQSIASHPDTVVLMVRSDIVSFMIPFLRLTQQTRSSENVRLCVLGILGSMLKLDLEEVVRYFLGLGVVPHLLRHMEIGTAMNKALSALVLQGILRQYVGREFICRNESRLTHVVFTLERVVHQLTIEPEPRVLKQVVRCYINVTDNRKALMLLKEHLPVQLRNGYFCNQLQEGFQTVPKLLEELNIKIPEKPLTTLKLFG